MESIRQFLLNAGLPATDPRDCPGSKLRFADDAEYRIEIPSTEGPRSFRAVIDEADKRCVPVHRISQGSGIMLLTDDEIREMAEIGAENEIEVNLFLGPRACFDIGAQAVSAAGKSLALSVRGADQLVFSINDVKRAAALGINSVLVSDIGVLQVIGKMKKAGELPPDLIVKTSVMMAPPNPASARLLEDLGATTINIPSDLTLPQICSIRAAISAPIDFYGEAPDNIGGCIRYYEIPELIRCAAPVYLKFGLRNSPDVYPSGAHLESTVIALSRERVRRAEIAMEHILRHAPAAVMSKSKVGGAR